MYLNHIFVNLEGKNAQYEFRMKMRNFDHLWPVIKEPNFIVFSFLFLNKTKFKRANWPIDPWVPTPLNDGQDGPFLQTSTML